MPTPSNPAPIAQTLRDFLDRREFLTIAIFFLTINFITMPKFAYRGDPMAVRCAAAHLIQKHSFGIGVDKAPAIQFLLDDSGAFFFLNKQKQQYFSKWGIVTTLLFTPPLAIDEIFFGIGQTYEPAKGGKNLAIYTRQLVFLMNLYNLALGLAIIWYLLKLAHLYIESVPLACVFTLASIYSTFLWNYLRAQSLEIFQVLFFLGLAYHLIVFMRSRTSGRAEWRQLLTATLYAGMLVLTKPMFCLLFPLLWIFSIATCAPEKRCIAATFDAVKADWKEYARWLALPTLVIALLGAALNQYQFGSPFESGYGQLNAAHIRFSAVFLPKATFGYLFHQRFSIFWHYPMLVFALFGAPAFLKKNPREFGFIVSAFLAVFIFVSCTSIWTSDWTYGPRYLLFALPALSLPFVETLRYLIDRYKSAAGLACSTIIAVTLLWSVKLQINTNSIPFLSSYELAGVFSPLQIQQVDDYFLNTNVGIVAGDFLEYKYRGKPYYPIEAVKPNLSKEQLAALPGVETFLRRDLPFQSNYYFFPDPPPPEGDVQSAAR